MAALAGRSVPDRIARGRRAARQHGAWIRELDTGVHRLRPRAGFLGPWLCDGSALRDARPRGQAARHTALRAVPSGSPCLVACAREGRFHTGTRAARALRVSQSHPRREGGRPVLRDAADLLASRSMRKLLVLVALLLGLPSSAFATWSVIAVDRETGRVVIASATCVNGDDMFLPGVQAVVVPGKGVAACQAAVDRTHQNQMLVFQELQKGTDPAAIIEMLSKDPAYETRQFGIVDLQGRAAGY